MYTGQDFYNDLLDLTQNTDQSALTPIFADQLFKRVTYDCINSYSLTDNTQASKDYLTTLKKTGWVISINNNQCFTTPLNIISVNIVDGTHFRIFFEVPHNLTNQDVTILGVLGTFAFSSPNGIYAITAGYTITSTTSITILVTNTTGAAVTQGTGEMTNDRMLADYLHLKAIEATFLVDTPYTLADATFTTPIKITVNEVNNIRDEDKFIISGVVGNTAANTTVYLKELKKYEAGLYSDKKLKTAIVGNGIYTSGGIMQKIVSYWCQIMESDQKIQFQNVTLYSPKVETADRQLKVYGAPDLSDVICTSIKVDYLTKAAHLIDSTNTTFDFDLIYPKPMQIQMVTRAAVEYFVSVGDEGMAKSLSATLGG